MVLGMHCLTLLAPKSHESDGRGRAFSNTDEIKVAYELGQVNIHAKVELAMETCFDDNHLPYADGKPRRRQINAMHRR